MRFLGVSILIVVCAMAQDRVEVQPQPWEAPSNASSLKNPLKDKPQLAAGGEKLFLQNCASCHAFGPKQKGPKFSAASLSKRTDGDLFWKISHGNSRSGMPAFSSLPEGQRWQLVLYLRTLQQRANN